MSPSPKSALEEGAEPTGARVSMVRGCAVDTFLAVARSEPVALFHCVSMCRAMSGGFAVDVVNRFGRPQGPSQRFPSVFVQNVGARSSVYHLVTKSEAQLTPTLRDFTSSLTKGFRLAALAGIKHVVMPRIGCGLDRLEWENVYPLICDIAARVAPGVRVSVVTRPPVRARTLRVCSEPRRKLRAVAVNGAVAPGEPHAVRHRLRERIATLQLARAPISQDELDAATVVAYRVRKELSRAAAHGQRPEHFPLRRVRKRPRKCSLDQLFGSDTTAPVSTWNVPDKPDTDCVSTAPLPRVRKLAEQLVSRVNPLDHLPPVPRQPVSLPWLDIARLPTGRFKWGAQASLKDLPLEKRQVWRNLLEKEIRVGALEVVERPEQVRLLTPPFIAYHPVTLKPRLVHDLRPLNARLRNASAKYETIRDALVHHRRLGTKLDLAQAFKHIALDEEAASMMSFAIDGVWFRWRRLPFGMAWSPAMFSEALRPTIEALRREGVRLVVYVDDVLVLADTVSRLDADTSRTMQLLQAAGWRVSPDKTYPFAHDRIVFLGILLDLRHSSAHVPPHKAEKLRALVTSALEGPRVTLCLLQKILGLLAFFLVAVPTVGLAWKAMIDATVEASRNPGRHVHVAGGLEQELQFWQRAAVNLPSWPAWRPNSTVDWYLATDSSDVGSGAIWWKGGSPAPSFDDWKAGKLGAAALKETESFEFLGDHGEQSSAFRELVGLWRSLWKRFGKPGDSGTWDAVCSTGLSEKQLDVCAKPTSRSPGDPDIINVAWSCDSAAGVGALGKWRSPSKPIQRVLLAIASFCLAKGIVVSATWISRNHGWLPVADWLSRTVGRLDSAEWSLPYPIVEGWMTRWGFTPSADMFATSKNHLFDQYFSQHPEPGSMGNALSSTWPARSYAFPPFSLAPHAISQWRLSAPPGAVALFVLPELSGLEALLEGLQVRKLSLPAEARLLNSNGIPASDPPPTPLSAYLLAKSAVAATPSPV